MNVALPVHRGGVFAHQLQHMIVTGRTRTALNGDRLRANLRQCVKLGGGTRTPGLGVGGGMGIAGSIPAYVVDVNSAPDITAVMCLLTGR